MNVKDAELFLELETSLHKKEVRSSAEALSKLLADDFVEFGSSGRTFNKSAIIQSLSREKTDLKVSVENFSAQDLAANAVLVTYVGKHAEGGSGVIRTLRSSIWKRIDGNWQMIFHQGTKIPTIP